MSQPVRALRRLAFLSAALVLAACVPAPAPKPPPKPTPEPPQATPSAEALGPARIVEPVCAKPPANGQIVQGAVSQAGLNYYEIDNRTAVTAVVKIRTDDDGPLVVAVYVAPHSLARIGPLDDGTYRQTYAMGGDLAPDCRRLDDPSGYGQYQRSDTFVTTLENGELTGQSAGYTLEENDIDGGDGPQALTAEKYNAP
jgi:hypothetical protein